jgi:uncharacterized membrane protein YukC
MTRQLLQLLLDWWPYIAAGVIAVFGLLFALFFYLIYVMRVNQKNLLASSRSFADAQIAQAERINETLEKIAASLDKK